MIITHISSPLYSDPIHLAPTDPTLIAGPDGNWRMFYTQRRAADPGPGVRWVHGTDIGVAVSTDDGRRWHYAGTVRGLDPLPGRNTLWAPEVIFDGSRYHMFTSHIVGVPDEWAGHDRTILHHTSEDLVHWDFVGTLPLSSSRVIDACAYPLPGGGWRLWYKDEAAGSTTWSVDSADLMHWSKPVQVIGQPGHEGPNVFALGGTYWMITDEWKGQAVHSSTDLTRWKRSGMILDSPGHRPWDMDFGRHADVVVGRDLAGDDVGWIFYFTHRGHRGMPSPRQTDIQVATLRVRGQTLTCDRDAPVDLDLTRAVEVST